MMMDILMYLFETYIHSDAELQVDQNELEDELIRAGFQQKDILKALQWLEELALLHQNDSPLALISNEGKVPSTRVYTVMEMERLDAKSRGFLLFLEQVEILKLETREMVIDRVMGLETKEFDLEDLKWIVLMVLFNVPGHEQAYTLMEELIYTQEQGLMH